MYNRKYNTKFCIAGYIAQAIMRSGSCDVCKTFLTSNRQPELLVHQLIGRRDHGGLVYPSHGLCKLVAYAETIFRSYMSIHHTNQRFSPLFLKIAVMERCNTCELLDMDSHALESQTGVSNHHEALVGKIMELFYRLRMQQISKLHNQEMHEQCV